MDLHGDAVRLLTAWQPRDEYGAQARAQTLDLLAVGPDALRREHLAGHLTASALIVHDDREQVLLCLHGRLNKWIQLGGHCEPEDATLAGTALREATEESGIEGLVIDPAPIGIDVHPVHCSAGPTHHYDVRFAVLAPPGAIEHVSPESHALGWFRADALPTPLADATERLIRPSLARFNVSKVDPGVTPATRR